MRHAVLIAEDEDMTHGLTAHLTTRGFRTAAVRDSVAAIREARDRRVSAAFLAERPLDEGWERALKAIRRSAVDLPVVLVSRSVRPETVFSASAGGAADCLGYPLEPGAFDRLVARLEREGTASPRCRLRDERSVDPVEVDMVVGRSQGMIDALRISGSVAETDVKVLIRGESGTGKELLARAIHRASGRPGAFVAVNCAAVVETLAESELFGHERGAFTGAVARRAGCFEQADGGTLFLDEIGDASPSFQAKLLRVLDRGDYHRVGGRDRLNADARIISATNQDLEAMSENGRFRGDLYYRLSEISLTLPPLRDRQCDIPELTARLLEGAAAEGRKAVRGVSEEALERLLAFPWPGNVRQLQNVLTRATILCQGGVILPQHLEGIHRAAPDRVSRPCLSLNDMERAHIARVLEVTGGNRGRACELLGITRPTLRRKMRHYGLAEAT
jgi:DNA-binding NtrC family response regulator